MIGRPRLSMVGRDCSRQSIAITLRKVRAEPSVGSCLERASAPSRPSLVSRFRDLGGNVRARMAALGHDQQVKASPGHVRPAACSRHTEPDSSIPVHSA
jgi:hypothetical protein